MITIISIILPKRLFIFVLDKSFRLAVNVPIDHSSCVELQMEIKMNWILLKHINKDCIIRMGVPSWNPSITIIEIKIQDSFIEEFIVTNEKYLNTKFDEIESKWKKILSLLNVD